ncbi:MAG: hypothetical protein UW95_C0004G0005 [Parcubacteria group bacterium GW2011_GWC1_45_14]|nr:MAG: hypothetical protein UW87_C0009G0007 [Candidatus Moranbacteria bacterium GW2011_GWC2_45_10]KKT95087.1 MAG: hypothetical protein UW95_C0004G0005 [Parcubacteria group bacterium GW2011_GWC1_45_14]
MEIMSISENAIKALDFFSENKPPKLDLDGFSLPFVVGSVNAFNTGKILFSDKAAVFADESNFKTVIKSYSPIIEKGLIKKAIVISASGEKDSVWEVELAKEYGLETTLLTCNADSSAARIADKVVVYRKIAEPYSYNMSTYLGMMLSVTREDPKKIKGVIENLEFPKNFSEYESFAFVLPDRFVNVCPMIETKEHELFGGHVSIRAFSQGHARHAKFIVRSEKDLVITINGENEYFGHPDHRWNISVPEDLSFGAMMAISYYICGRIQEARPPYFTESIDNYCKDYGPKAYGKDTPFETIVPGN